MFFVILQVKSFLQVYNQITEICFKSCVDNLSTRKCTTTEDKCVDHCFRKFSSANQRLLASYVEAQGEINRRRAADLAALERAAIQKQQEEQLQAQAAAEAAAAANQSSPVQPEEVAPVVVGTETV